MSLMLYVLIKGMIYKGKKINMNKKIYVLIADFVCFIRHFGL